MNNAEKSSRRYTSYQYLPPDPRYFDYENRYHVPNQLYTPGLSPEPVATTPGIEEFLQQKQYINQYQIQMIYAAMGVRSYINGQILYRINYDQCTCRKLIMGRGGIFYDRQRMELENKILDLESEKRREETAFFRDLSFLNKELRFAKIEALEEKHKQALCLNMEETI
jgi:hypothetical protein